MNKDIRLNLSFSTHRKRKKLYSALGPQGILSLIDLWLSTAANRPKGILTGMNETDIAMDAQWSGDPAEFCRTLQEIGFLDRGEDGTYSIHDWKDHQRYAYFSKERSEMARELAERRWNKRFEKGKENQIPDAKGNAKGNTDGNAPLPIPYPIPNPKDNMSPSQVTPNCPHEEIVSLYHQILPSLPRVKAWTEERKKHLRARWAEDPKRQNLEWWERYFEHVGKSPFLTGTNDRGWIPNLEWLVRQRNLLNVIEGKYHKAE